MIRLGLRLTLGSGREALLRVLVTAAAVALGVGLLLAALAGTAETSNPAETPTEQAATSSAQATVLRRRTGRGVSHSRAAPAR